MSIAFNKPKRERLRAAHKDAVANGLEVFEFEGNELVVGYAKYMLQYLDLPEINAKLPDGETQ